MSDDNVETLPEAIQQLNKRGLALRLLECVRIHSRPFTEDTGDQWHASAAHYVVTIACEKRTLTTFYSTGALRKDKPGLSDVLGCLVSDARSADQTFAEWCSDLGYDTDSRRALATHEACVRTRAALLTLIGSREYLERLTAAEW